MFVKCPKCGTQKRTYALKFICCGEKHDSRSNDAFPPKVQDISTNQVQTPKSKIEEKQGGEATVETPQNPVKTTIEEVGLKAEPSLQTQNNSIYKGKPKVIDNSIQPNSSKVAGEKSAQIPQPTDTREVAELEVEAEPETKPKVNPDDYKFQCGSCRALFNEHEGVCPACKEELVL